MTGCKHSSQSVKISAIDGPLLVIYSHDNDTHPTDCDMAAQTDSLLHQDPELVDTWLRLLDPSPRFERLDGNLSMRCLRQLDDTSIRYIIKLSWYAGIMIMATKSKVAEIAGNSDPSDEQVATWKTKMPDWTHDQLHALWGLLRWDKLLLRSYLHRFRRSNDKRTAPTVRDGVFRQPLRRLLNQREMELRTESDLKVVAAFRAGKDEEEPARPEHYFPQLRHWRPGKLFFDPKTNSAIATRALQEWTAMQKRANDDLDKSLEAQFVKYCDCRSIYDQPSISDILHDYTAKPLSLAVTATRVVKTKMILAHLVEQGIYAQQPGVSVGWAKDILTSWQNFRTGGLLWTQGNFDGVRVNDIRVDVLGNCASDARVLKEIIEWQAGLDVNAWAELEQIEE